jgi:hypothetical protein
MDFIINYIVIIQIINITGTIIILSRFVPLSAVNLPKNAQWICSSPPAIEITALFQGSLSFFSPDSLNILLETVCIRMVSVSPRPPS